MLPMRGRRVNGTYPHRVLRPRQGTNLVPRPARRLPYGVGRKLVFPPLYATVLVRFLLLHETREKAEIEPKKRGWTFNVQRSTFNVVNSFVFSSSHPGLVSSSRPRISLTIAYSASKPSRMSATRTTEFFEGWGSRRQVTEKGR